MSMYSRKSFVASSSLFDELASLLSFRRPSSTERPGGSARLADLVGFFTGSSLSVSESSVCTDEMSVLFDVLRSAFG